MEREPIIIGISGGSCSGKTTLGMRLREEFLDKALLLPFDSYMDDRVDIKKISSFEEPELYDFRRFVADLSTLRRGASIELVYNAHDVQGSLETLLIPPKPIIICEGFLIFHDLEARNMVEHRYFIDVPDSVLSSRRQQRRELNNYWNEPEYIDRVLIPAHHQYVLPQRNYAHQVLDGRLPRETLFQQLMTSLGQRGV